ncbi:endonuclease NucS [Halalkalicoccus paucihalophilus]|uniref:Endonuclease NucS n=1 Tax=Halalkalicoccus paucihalophilus TaxID=1008153 RepID=A0A151AII2_9EURY|nr:endonuclease NucS [Halalkalicoccus paucihalophilus]
MTATEETVVLSEPSAAEARDRLASVIERGGLFTLFGECTVEYDGRAASSLGPGRRHVMCKPDGTVLVHTDEGQKPINWQPPGSRQAVRIEAGSLVLDSRRENPDEELVIRFERIAHLAIFETDGGGGASLSVTGTEEDLKRRILEEPELIEAGFRPLATERSTPAGAVDIYGEDEEGRVVVLELKRRRVGPDAVGQLSRYVEALERDLHAGCEIRGILVAPSVTDRAHRLLTRKGLEFVALSP